MFLAKKSVFNAVFTPFKCKKAVLRAIVLANLAAIAGWVRGKVGVSF